MGTLDFVLTAIQLLQKYVPVAIQAGNDLKPFAVELYKLYSGGADPTPEEMAALEKQVDDLAARLQEPLPPAQPGDPDYRSA